MEFKLRKLQEGDIPGMLGWMHDPDTSSLFAADFARFDAERVHAFIESAQTDAADLHRACVDGQNRYLGTVSLKRIDHEAKNAEYAVSFCKEARGTGASLFATREILKIAFGHLELERVYLNVLAENHRANAFYRKAGFIYEGCFEKHLYIRGTLHDLNWYRMLKEEYQRTIQ